MNTQRKTSYSQFYTAVASLLLYAVNDTAFAQKLQSLIAKNVPLRNKASQLPFVPSETVLLIPETNSAAQKRAQWLIRELTRNSDEETNALLAAWLSAMQSTKPQRQLVVGLVGLAIPGPTLGELKKRKKMPVIIRRGLVHTRNSLTKNIAHASADTFAQALQYADGVTAQLEPEMGTWFFEKTGFKYYTADEHTLETLAKTLHHLAIPSSTSYQNGFTSVVAASPILNTHNLSRMAPIQPIYL